MDAQAVSNATAKNGLVGLATSGGLSRQGTGPRNKISDPDYIDERRAHRTREPGALDENRVPRARQGAHCLDSGGWRGDAGDRPPTKSTRTSKQMQAAKRER